MTSHAMPAITALLHTKNDARRLGRCLETLYACDEILIVDHGSQDATVRVARQYGARVAQAAPDASCVPYPPATPAEWILALDPRESLSEGLAASLFEWKTEWKAGHSGGFSSPAFAVVLHEQSAEGWIRLPAQTRLVPGIWKRWEKGFPMHQASAVTLEGALWRFGFP